MSSFQSLRLVGRFLLTSSLFLCFTSFNLYDCVTPVSYNDCTMLQSRLKKLTTDLASCRKAIKTANEDIPYCQKQISNFASQIADYETKKQFVEKGSLAYKALDKSIADARTYMTNSEKKLADSKKILKSQTANEKILIEDFHRTRDRIDAECGGVKKDPPKPVIPDAAGSYNSPDGDVVITKQVFDTHHKLTAVVHYSSGGSSTLKGDFDGKKWNFTWRNTFSHYGKGYMSYNPEDGSFTGYWTDETPKATPRGNWWLRRK